MNTFNTIFNLFNDLIYISLTLKDFKFIISGCSGYHNFVCEVSIINQVS